MALTVHEARSGKQEAGAPCVSLTTSHFSLLAPCFLLLASCCAVSIAGPAGCKRPTTPAAAAPAAPPAKEIAPLIGVTNQLRLQITPSPNPPYMGSNTFDLWLGDPQKLLDPVPNARITLKLSPPADSLLPTVSSTVKTDKDGRAEGHLALTGAGEWTLTASVDSSRNGTLTMTGTVPVRTLPGQVDRSPRKAPGPAHSLVPAAPPHPKGSGAGAHKAPAPTRTGAHKAPVPASSHP